MVLKVGNYHCGENKFLLNAGQKMPFLKYKLRNDEVLFEEFVPNARSIRIGFVGNPRDNKNLFISEHVNSKRAAMDISTSWIKNIDPIETSYLHEDRHLLHIKEIDELIEESRRIAIYYNTDLIGIDWAISDDKIGILELNDMIGIPYDERVVSMFKQHALSISKEFLKNLNYRRILNGEKISNPIYLANVS